MKTTIKDEKNYKENEYSLKNPIKKTNEKDINETIRKDTSEEASSVLEISSIETSTGKISINYDVDNKHTLVAFSKKGTIFRNSTEFLDNHIIKSHSGSKKIGGFSVLEQASEENMLVVEKENMKNYKELKKNLANKINKNPLAPIVTPVLGKSINNTSVENELESKFNKSLKKIEEIRSREDFYPVIMRKKIKEEDEEETVDSE